jgi:serine phosphatase RsbU (regulator of sigma subunit)
LWIFVVSTMKIKLTTFFFCCLCCCLGLHGFLYAQTTDTLLISLEKKQPDTATVIRLLKAAVKLPDTLFQKKLAYANKALEISQQIDYKEGAAKAYWRLGSVYFYLGNYDQSLDNGYKALQLADKFTDKYFKSSLLQQIGKTHEIQRNLKQAEDYYNQSLEINKALALEQILAYDYSNLANLKMLQGDYEKSLVYRNEEIRLKEKMKDTLGLAFTYNDIAVSYFNQNKIKEGLPYIEKATKIIEKLPTNYYKSALFLTLAETYFRLGRNNEAEKIATFHLNESKKLQTKDIATLATGVLYQVNSNKKDYKKAFEYLLLNTQLRDSTYNEKRLKEIAQLETNFQIKQQQKENELLKRENDLKTEEIKVKDAEAATNRLLIGLSAAVLVLLLGVVAIFYRNIQLKKKTNDLLLKKNTEINEQKEEISAIANDLRSANDAISLKNQEIEEKNQDILASINYAKRIQQAMLPLHSYFETTFGKDNFFIFYQPKDIVSGDFYWLTTHKNTVVLAVADCTGHGVPGAFMSMIGNDLLNEIVNLQHIFSPDQILQYLNKGVNKVLQQDKTQSRDGMDIAIITLQKEKNIFTTLEYAGAMNPIYVIQDQENTEIKADKKPIGGYHITQDGERSFTKHQLNLQKDEQQDNYTTVYLCSDGYQDQFGGTENRKFMVKRLREMFFNTSTQAMQTQHETLQTTFNQWKGNYKQIDDVLVIGLRLKVGI